MEVVRSVPLYQQVYNQLRQEIISGNIRSETSINEVHLARELEVSRGPVREAIRILEQEGLLIRDNKNQLRPYHATIEDLEHIYQCRQVLEMLAVKLAASRISKARLQDLEVMLQKKELLLDETDAGEFSALCSEFHNIIIASCGNPRLQQQIKHLRSLTFLYRHKNANGQSRRNIIVSDHRKILQFLRENKPDEAEAFMKEHIERDLQNLISLYQNGELEH